MPSSINLSEILRLFDEQWSPRIVAQMNDHHIKLVKVQGEFVWHSHPESDEVFVVIEGTLLIELRDSSVTLTKGEMIVIPQGVDHKPSATKECHLLLIERAGTINTGDAAEGNLTAGEGTWL